MNRRERRANAKQAARITSLQVDALLRNSAGNESLFTAAMTHYRKGEFALAQSLCRAILASDPAHVASLVLLGDMAQQGGQNDVAVKLLRQAIALDGGDPAAHDNIALAYQALGRRDEAVRHFMLAIATGLAGVEAYVKQTTAVAAALGRLARAWPRVLPLAELLGSPPSGRITGEALLLALLQSKPAADVELERLLAAIRRALLRRVTDGEYSADTDDLVFFCALAQQCFINEYVFAFDDDERELVQQVLDRVADAVKTDTEIAPLDLIVVANYRPLHELPFASALVARPWPEAIERLLTLQVREPFEERAERANIPALTAVEDATSRQVQTQYEENPFPRWVVGGPRKPTTLPDYLREQLGVTIAPEAMFADGADTLIAGCGTGRHSIDTAHLFPRSRILAVDISRASLAYARRKTRALGVSNIEYAQADILKIGSIARRFDVIETVGVLHHLADPEAGWRALLSLLKPNGLMLVGLYSALARQFVTDARAFIAERGYRATADGIRAYRQDVIGRGQVPPSGDFFSMSMCRDLVFNVVEHQFTIPRIAAFLAANGLTFLGFERLPAGVVEQFQRRFPGADAMRDLDCWHRFEQAHPATFIRMYNFWVQRREPAAMRARVPPAGRPRGCVPPSASAPA